MSSLSIGIVGLPNVGKSTLFNALTRSGALAANYPFATIEPNVGIVSVPDYRLDELAKLYPGAPIVPASIRFTDIAGLVAGASKGEGLGNQFLANIRETAAIAHVVRAFKDDNVTHVENDVDPVRDIETIHTELILADLQSVEKKISSIEKLAKSDPSARKDFQLLKQLGDALGEGKLITNFIHPDSIDKFLDKADTSSDVNSFVRQLITAKPFVFVFNVDEETLKNPDELDRLSQLVAPHESVYICAQLEAELDGLEPSEQLEMLREYGLDKSGLERLVQTCFSTLHLQSFFTAGDKEVKAWTIPQGASAPQAAGAIHTDFQRGFIAAEVINWKDLLESGSRSKAKTLGKVRTEGKDYRMQDGDVVEFRFNV